ncbi:hypothetical protein YOLOSWAG_81 [Erwinia phage vB_EamM_Yoloswag]|uniref:Uncharacterized protein n=1 Tax=Erwinia phage vB_EamM_Yoloswag TaxID=1958956 RepID=A0A1S6L303_9CAUD|nr:hypothetical protein HOR66_gp081 [Erwinia phage vB_EamM_Yoloswag]AQT28564.1 hypothetical protein YOLOSWAG_81 [Erwinia phage vB_EamM_Yoloswag]
MSNAMSRQALNTALLFDSTQSVADVHLGYDQFLAAAVNARAYINNSDTATGAAETTPVSGKLGDYYYPAKSPALTNNATATTGANVYGSNSTTMTVKQVVDRYFTVQPSADGQDWADVTYPVFTGQNGPSTETSLGKYWPSSCMMLVPQNKKLSGDNKLYTYSSRAVSMYTRIVDSFWKTATGDDGGYCNANLDMSTLKEVVSSGQVIQSTTVPTVSPNIPSLTAANNNLLFVRPISHRYSANGLNQYSYSAVGSLYATTGNTGFTRDSADAFAMRLAADAALPDDSDAVFVKAVAVFKCGPDSCMLRAYVGQDKELVQSGSAPVAAAAKLIITANTDFMSNETVFDI